MRKLSWLLTISIVIGLLAACSPEESMTESAELTAVRLPMGYIPDPQYAPFYVADSMGYFADASFDVEFDYSFETDGVALVGTGELPFAVVSGEQALLARAQGVPVVYVAEWFQRYPIAVVAKVENGIAGPQDLIGRDVGLPGFFGAGYVGYVGLLSANGLTEQQVNGTDIGFTSLNKSPTTRSRPPSSTSTTNRCACSRKGTASTSSRSPTTSTLSLTALSPTKR